jgi:hypothetical protein
MAEMEQEDATGVDDPDEAPMFSHGRDGADSHGSHKLCRRLENQRWKENRCGKVWTNEPEPLPRRVFEPAEQKVSTEKVKRGRPGGRQIVQLTAKTRAQQNAQQTSPHDSIDFELLVHLMDPEEGSKVPPHACVPLMFWLGFARQRQACFAVFEMAFGIGNVPKEKILELEAYLEVQIEIAEVFRTQARKESFDQLCEYITNHENLRVWYSALYPDSRGLVEIGQILKMFMQMDVKVNKKMLYRFISHFTMNYQGNISRPSTDAETCLADRAQCDFPFLCTLLSRCVVTSCIVQVLELVNPTASSQSGRVSGSTGLEASAQSDSAQGASSNIKVEQDALRRWAQLHRRIVVSLMVNQRYWGREGKITVASLTQTDKLPIFEGLSPEHWVGLYQRVRAQGLASTFPEHDADYDDPEFLSKRATCAVDFIK